MLKVLELFAGIGACSKALTNLGIEHEIVDAVEIDKFAIKSFNAIHGTNFEPQDIIKWNKDLDDVDLIMHGSPCQDFSVAGKGAGGDEGSGTRSSLMYEPIRIVSKLQPKYVIWENVKAVLSKKHVHNFQNYLDQMAELGYKSHYQVLSAKDFGVPQNRERVFTISIRGNLTRKFVFPMPTPLKKNLCDILETDIKEIGDNSISEPKVALEHYLKHQSKRDFVERKYKEYQTKYHHIPKIFNPYNQTEIIDIAPTQTAQCSSFTKSATMLFADGYGIRKLTPRECWRLMGFSDGDFNQAEKVNSNTQLYKQAGNSIVVNVLQAILSNLLEKK